MCRMYEGFTDACRISRGFVKDLQDLQRVCKGFVGSIKDLREIRRIYKGFKKNVQDRIFLIEDL